MLKGEEVAGGISYRIIKGFNTIIINIYQDMMKNHLSEHYKK
ncbi:MAG: hypothetical protein ABSE83_09605 [Methanobacterium sp.]